MFVYTKSPRPFWLLYSRRFAHLCFGLGGGSNYPFRSCNGSNGLKGPKFKQNKQTNLTKLQCINAVGKHLVNYFTRTVHCCWSFSDTMQH